MAKVCLSIHCVMFFLQLFSCLVTSHTFSKTQLPKKAGKCSVTIQQIARSISKHKSVDYLWKCTRRSNKTKKNLNQCSTIKDKNNKTIINPPQFPAQLHPTLSYHCHWADFLGYEILFLILQKQCRHEKTCNLLLMAPTLIQYSPTAFALKPQLHMQHL